jgi:ABC-type multidrug transport system fused ATPase/permease subunit
MISESECQSQKSSRQASRATSIHEIEREGTESTVASVDTDTESRTKISLDTRVSEGGSNFSSGQRQLIAMVYLIILILVGGTAHVFFSKARALLRRSSIIILDEVSNVFSLSDFTG